jgi:hypothetical protein
MLEVDWLSRRPMRALSLCLGLFVATLALADEGMWTYDNVPKARIKARYGFEPTDAWLRKAMLSSARLAGGCSASFVSGSGLVMTNHHCARSCVQQLSTQEHDFIKNGFYAAKPEDEVRCPEIEVNQLTQITDVTDRVNKATAGLEGEARKKAEVAVKSTISKECQTTPDLRCDVVTLYHGGQYHLYHYKRYQDVRLVFAPEEAIAFFGGDPDNFMFPRYDLDVSFLRVYENGKPLKAEHYFGWSKTGAKDGELTFVSGHPGATERQLTVAQLEYQRDVALPERLMFLAQVRGYLTEYQHRGPEQKRHSNDVLFGTENSYKALSGRFQALTDKTLFQAKVAEENSFRDKVAQDPAQKQTVGGAWDAIAKATQDLKTIRKQLAHYQGAMLGSKMFGFAKVLVQGTAELQKPNEQRYPEFSDAALPEVTQRLFSKAPVYPELEIARLTFGLTKMREDLGPDDPFVKKVLGTDSPEALATRLINGSKLADPVLREQLWKGGAAAVKASTDPMVQFAFLIDPDARAIRQKYESTIEPVITKSSELIARARFQMEGTSHYPDATFTLRLSFGQVRGYDESGHHVNPLTTLDGAFTRATGSFPFALPDSWLKAKSSLTLGTPFDMATTNDIIGGNSGSPMFNKDLEITGLVFDGNIESLGGEYGFDENVNRAVAVESAALLEALKKIYHADRVVKELKR